MGVLAMESFAAGQSQGTYEGKESVQNPMTFTVGVLQGPSGFGIVKMIEDLASLPQNVETVYQVIPSPAEMVARLASRELQAGLLPLNMAAKLYTKDAGYPLAAIPGRGALYLLSRDDGLNNWTDLGGKSVYAVGKGATPDYLMHYFLAEKGIDEESITMNFSLPALQLAQMAIAGRVDTLLIPQPFVALVQMKSPDMTIRLDFQETWMELRKSEQSYPITAFVVDPQFALERTHAFAELLTSYQDSIAWVLNNQDEAALLIEKHGIFAAGPAKAAIPNCGLEFTAAQYAREDVEAYLQVLLDSDPVSVGGSLPDENFYLAP